MGTKFRPSTKMLQSLIFDFPLCSKDIGMLKKNIQNFYPHKHNNYVSLDIFRKICDPCRVLTAMEKLYIGKFKPKDIASIEF